MMSRYWLGVFLLLNVALCVMADYERELSAEEDALNENLLRHLAKRSAAASKRYQMMMQKKMKERQRMQAKKQAEERAAEDARKMAEAHAKKAKMDSARRAARQNA